MTTSSDGPDPASEGEQSHEIGGPVAADGETSVGPSEQALVEHTIERGDAVVVWTIDSIDRVSEAVERTRRHVECTQRELDRRRGRREA